jgi:two-component SAPR family response regulator
MITAIAIDDDPLGLVIINAFCSRVDFIDLQKTFTDPNEALAYLQKKPVDLLFLDIQMPAISGIDFYKSIGQNTI